MENNRSRRGRFSKTDSRQKQDKTKKSGWVRPDGKPMRRRKDNYFPDEEIERHKPGRRSRPVVSGNENNKPGRPGAERAKEGRRFERKPERKKFERSGPSFSKETKSTTFDFSKPVRLNRYIANAGICSRREADDLIAAGVISVNGSVVTELGTRVNPGDTVKFHDKVLKGEKLVYVLLNKPKDFITTTDDPQERRTVMNLVRDACRERIVPVGRLDRNTTGLLLFTNDGELTKKLTHPSSNVSKIYQVELDRGITREEMNKTLEGVELEDGVSGFDDIQYDVSGDKKLVGVELHSGRNRVVRRVFEALGLRVKKLDRVVFAGLTKKDLPRGRWRFLTEMEVNMLKMKTGKK